MTEGWKTLSDDGRKLLRRLPLRWDEAHRLHVGGGTPCELNYPLFMHSGRRFDFDDRLVNHGKVDRARNEAVLMRRMMQQFGLLLVRSGGQHNTRT